MANAKQEKKEDVAQDAAPPKKSKKMLVIILAVVLLIVFAGGGVAFWLMKKKAAEEDGVDPEEEVPVKTSKKPEKPAHPPVFMKLDVFTVNLMPDETGADRYLQTELALEVSEASVDMKIKERLPKIKNDLMLYLSSKKASDFATMEQKKKVATEIKDSLNELLKEKTEGKKKGKAAETPELVEEVLFASFIIQ